MQCTTYILLVMFTVESQEGLKPLTEWDNVNYGPLLRRWGEVGVAASPALVERGVSVILAWGRPAYRRLFRLPSLSFGEGFAIFSPQRSQPRRGPLAERLTQTRRLLAVYTGASSPSFLSSFLSALCAVGHVHASVDAASSIIASASHVRIFHRGCLCNA